MAKNQIIDLMHLLLLKYKPPTVASTPVAPPTAVPVAPATGVPIAATASTSAASTATAGTSVPPTSISDIHLSSIPKVNTLGVYHFFGFTRKPSS
jgi:hypothetical protein